MEKEGLGARCERLWRVLDEGLLRDTGENEEEEIWTVMKLQMKVWRVLLPECREVMLELIGEEVWQKLARMVRNGRCYVDMSYFGVRSSMHRRSDEEEFLLKLDVHYLSHMRTETLKKWVPASAVIWIYKFLMRIERDIDEYMFYDGDVNDAEWRQRKLKKWLWEDRFPKNAIILRLERARVIIAGVLRVFQGKPAEHLEKLVLEFAL